MDATVEGVFEAVRGELGDTFVPGGQIFKDDVVRPFFEKAYEKLIGRLQLLGAQRIRKTVYYNLPARTSILTPSQLGVTDFGEPELVWERGALSKVAITSAAAGTPVVLLASGHPFADGDEVIVTRLASSLNGRWFASYVDSSHFSLNGSTSTIVYAPSGAYATHSHETFVPVDGKEDLPQFEIGERLLQYSFDEVFRFRGALTERQLKIIYFSSGVTPQSGQIGIDGCRNFLVSYTAAAVAPTRDKHTRAKQLTDEAKEHLEQFVRNQVKAMQKNQYRPAPYRRRRYVY